MTIPAARSRVSVNEYLYQPYQGFFTVMRSTPLTPYSCNDARKTYTHPPLYDDPYSYRRTVGTHSDTVDLIELLDPIEICFSEVWGFPLPTIHKFMTRVPSAPFHDTAQENANFFYSDGEIVTVTALDSSGIHQFLCQPLLLLVNRKTSWNPWSRWIL